MKNRKNKLPKHIVFLEFRDEAKVFLRHYRNEIARYPENFMIITFHRLVKQFLLTRGIRSIDSFHFCPTESRKRLLCKLEEYTKDVRRECSIRDSFGIGESYTENLLFYLRAILSSWLYRVEVISNTTAYYKSDTIITIGSERIMTARTPNTEEEERYIRDIINQASEKKKIAVKRLCTSYFLSWLRRLLSTAFEKFARNLLCDISRCFIKPGKNSILALTDSYGMANLLKGLRKDLGERYDLAVLGISRKFKAKDILKEFTRKKTGAFRYFFYNADRKTRFSRSFLKERNEFRSRMYALIDSWTYRDISPAKWLKPKYGFALEPGIIEKTYYNAFNLNRFLDKWRPMFVLSPNSRSMTAVAGELCRLKGIPSVVIPQGPLTPITDKHSAKEWRENALGLVDTPYTYLAIQNLNTEKFLSEIQTKNKPIITGPLILGVKNKSAQDSENLRKKFAPSGEKIILHAGTPKDRKSQRLLNYETIDEYVDGIASLINAVNKIKGIYLIVRYRVVDGLSVEALRSLLPDSKRYSIASEGSFSDYLSIADLLVSFSSSTMEEALQNDIPVLQYNKYDRYRHMKGIELLPGSKDPAPSAVYNVNSEKNLPFALGWVIENHLLLKNPPKGIFDEYKYKPEEITKLSDLIRNPEKIGIAEIAPNANYHVIGKKNILDSTDAKFRKYRREWIENPEQFKVREFPLHLDIELTNFCNLKCAYCASTYNRWGSDKKGKMPFGLFKKIIDEGKENGLYSIKFSLRGESMLHEDLPRMVEYAKKSGIIDMYFNTNGMLLDRKTSDRLIEAGLNRISISCDGWDKKSFEKNRLGARFEDVYENIRELRDARGKRKTSHPKIRIQTVMLPEIKKHLKEFLDLWSPLADEIGYLDAREEGPGVDHRGLKANWACPFLWQRMVILWDGTILPCLLHGVGDSSSVEMGNAKDSTIKEKWLSKKMNDFRDLHKDGKSHAIKACDECSYRALEIKKLNTKE